MLAPALRRVLILSHGFEPTRGAFGPSIVKTGPPTLTRLTKFCLAKAKRIGRESSRLRKASAGSNIIWSSKREAGFRKWRLRGGAWRHSVRHMGDGFGRWSSTVFWLRR